MSDNRRVYRTIRQVVMQFYPGQPKGNSGRMLTTLAAIREVVFMIDGSEVGQGCITLVTSLLYGNRALPITWE